MADTNSPKPKSGATPSSSAASSEMPKFEVPKFDMPNLEVPAPLREFAEKGMVQAKDNWNKMKAASEEASSVLESSYKVASKSASEYGLKVIDISRANANSTFEFFNKMMAVKTAAQLVELSTAHMKSQFEMLTAQTKELSSLAQKVATDTVEPLKQSMTKSKKMI